MKKYILLFLFAFSLATTTSCTNDEDDDSIEVINPVDENDAKKNNSEPK